MTDPTNTILSQQLAIALNEIRNLRQTIITRLLAQRVVQVPDTLAAINIIRYFTQNYVDTPDMFNELFSNAETEQVLLSNIHVINKCKARLLYTHLIRNDPRKIRIIREMMQASLL